MNAARRLPAWSRTRRSRRRPTTSPSCTWGRSGWPWSRSATALEAVVERLAGRALIAVDPNCRPWVVNDHDAYRARLLRVLCRTATCSRSAKRTSPISSWGWRRSRAFARCEDGPVVGLLTRGPNGAIVVTPTEEVPVPAPRAKIVDTIGAGDAFGGGFLAWWSERGLTRDALTRIDTVGEATNCARAHAAERFRDEDVRRGA